MTELTESRHETPSGRKGTKSSIYEDWRSYENEEILLRPVRAEDAQELLRVYSDKEARKLFNIDNFPVPCFFDTLDEMKQELEFYRRSYSRREFVRWSVVEKRTEEVIGTVENFVRSAMDQTTGKPSDAFHNTMILRMDIRSDREKEEVLRPVLHLILETAWDDFACDRMATKAPPFASERRKVLEKAGFEGAEEVLVGHKGQRYVDYFIKKRP